MKEFENMPESIFDLLAEKKYSELTLDEKAQVDAFMNATDYESYRNIIFDFERLDQSSFTQKTELPKEKKRVSVFGKIMKYPIPLYQVAAVFLLLGAIIFIDLEEEKTEFPEEVVQVEKAGQSLAEDDYPEELVFNF